ncbi:uncharacterized protein (UPF0216 family) [Methanofollis sp. W23]|uniref:DUF61 family protein n=1 Tax=Methanofollis sp. W23 TaxID=2817849 RepID=UPI001AEB6D43|nr:DUF61 family protein [Methanofollis sp. W23]MBP2146112.1 uncharacterized protein (UPF0216 family) [Methanofollis sp. W23]
MSYRPNLGEESVLKKWISLEVGRIKDGLVAEKKSLARLLTESSPSAVTKGGKEHAFDREAVQMLGERLPEKFHFRLMLPVTFYSTLDITDSYYLRDETAFRALQALGELSEMREMREGKLWVSNAIVYAIMRKYPSLVEIGMG